MEQTDITDKVKFFIKFGLISLIILSAGIGYAVFYYYHATKNFQIDNAKVSGTMVSVRALTNGKIKELTFQDGAEVKAGDVIAKIEVSVTPEQIEQLETALELARQNYEDLKLGQTVKVPVKRTRVVEAPKVPAASSELQQNPGVRQPVPTTVEALEERARRMQELFEMGAVSAVQRDDAKKKYEDALINGIPPVENNSESGGGASTVEEIEYVDQWQPTPPAVLSTAESAIKQAELALNVAKQEAQQTEIIAPVDGIIYYSAQAEEDLSAGDVVAKVGSDKELWLEAEVDENIFEKIPLGKKVSYQIEGKILEGTLIEKISPEENEVPEATEAAEISAVEENKNDSPETATESGEPKNDKYILKFSIPAESDVDIKPNTKTSVNFNTKNIF